MIYLGSDHAGYELKEKLKRHLDAQDLQYEDLGTHSTDPVDYPDYAFKVADRAGASGDHRGILMCSTGVGMSIAANKVAGVRAAIGYSARAVERARNDGNINVLCLGAALMDEDEAMRAVDAFLTAPFSHEDRHERRVGKIMAREIRAEPGAEVVAKPGLDDVRAAAAARLEKLAAEGFAQRLWSRDPSVFGGDDEVHAKIANRLGWLGAAAAIEEELPDLKAFANDLASDGHLDVGLLGMGGSSLAPHVFSEVFGAAEGYLGLHVLDTTDPETIDSFLSEVELSKTIFVVASKSGTTIEPLSQLALFSDEMADDGLDVAGHTVALTDPGTPLEASALEHHYKRLFSTPADVGGRYSALTLFGMLPAALLGVDVDEIAARGQAMETACGPDVPETANPALWLGALLAEAATAGRDKLTLVTSEDISAFGLWVEQLVAESTGKQGRGIIPVVGEGAGEPEVYGSDRLFVVMRLAADEALRDWADEMRSAGYPLEEIVLRDAYDLGAEFVRWEIATATAGAILGVNPFDEPNVTEVKDLTRELLDAGGDLPKPDGHFDNAQVSLSDAAREAMTGADLSSARGAMSAMIGAMGTGDYFGLLAYLPSDGRVGEPLDRLRLALRDRLRVATCLEYGPRYLHSTGQAHKGGPNTGVFLIITRQTGVDHEVPGTGYTFGQLQLAQAQGDFLVLSRHGRRVMWVHLEAGGREELGELAEAAEGGSV